MARSSTPVNDISVGGYSQSVDDLLLVSPIKRICYCNSNNSVVPEKRHYKGVDLAVPDHSSLRGSLADSEHASHDSLVDITADDSSEDDVIYPSLLENTTGDSTTDVFYPSEDSLATSLSAATNPDPGSSSIPQVFKSVPTSSIPQVVSTKFATRASTSQLQVSPESLANVAGLLLSYCCEKQCLQNLTVAEVRRQQFQFQSLSLIQQRQWLMDYFHQNSHFINGHATTKYIVSGKEICKLAWCKVLEVSSKRVASALKSITDGQITVAEHGNKGRRRPLTKTEDAIAWMSKYFNLLGDHMPNSNKIHLPSWDSQKYVYQRYKDDMILEGQDEKNMVALRTFYRLWNENFPNVIIPGEDRFAKCDICVKVKNEKKGTMDKEIQKQLREKSEKHHDRVKKERQKYHKHREKSRANPEKYITIIIDGMDQAKSNIPNTKAISKSASGLWRLRTHLTGSLLHTKSPCGKLAFVFIDLLQWPHDSNLTITVLCNILLDYSQTHSLSETLYLQLDNTSRENKNRYLIGFCALLVESRVFKKIRINFLPVGHTHEDVDQLFSKISDEIRRNGSESLPGLVQVIGQSSTPVPKTSLLDGVWDFKSWIEPHLNDIKYHSKYICFRFTLNSSTGKAELHYKKFSDSPWEPEKEHLQILSGCLDVSKAPPLVSPSTDKLDLERLFRDLPKYKPWITAQSWDSWETFIANDKELMSVKPIPWEFLKLQHNAASAEAVRRSIPKSTITPETALLLEKETSEPKKIIIKEKRSASCCEMSSTAHEHLDEKFKCGDFVAVYLEKYKDEVPQIGKIVKEDSSNSIEVEWWTGSYSGTWNVYKYKSGREMVHWREVIPENSVLFRIELTRSNRLKRDTIDKLKAAYEPFMND